MVLAIRWLYFRDINHFLTGDCDWSWLNTVLSVSLETKVTLLTRVLSILKLTYNTLLSSFVTNGACLSRRHYRVSLLNFTREGWEGGPGREGEVKLSAVFARSSLRCEWSIDYNFFVDIVLQIQVFIIMSFQTTVKWSENKRFTLGGTFTIGSELRVMTAFMNLVHITACWSIPSDDSK